MQYSGQRVQIDVKVVPGACIADPTLKLYQYSAIDEHSSYRILSAYPAQSTYSSADFLQNVMAALARKGMKVECVQTDNGFGFINRFFNSRRNLQTLFEKATADLDIRHKLIRPYTPRHNGKFERSHRFYSLADFARQLAAHQSRSNSRPMLPITWYPPKQMLSAFAVKKFDKPTTPAVQKLLGKLDIAGCPVIANAMNYQKETAKAVVTRNTGHLLRVKR